MKRLILCCLLTPLLLLAGCTGNESDPLLLGGGSGIQPGQLAPAGTTGTTGTTGGTTTGTGGGTAATFNVSGRITYQRPTNLTTGWDFANLITSPVRDATVQVVSQAAAPRAQGQQVLATGRTDANGNYQISVTTAGSFLVRVRAETATPAITCVDNTNNNAVYVMDSPAQQPGADVTLNLNATTGFNANGTVDGSPRVASPFALLDDCYEASQAFLTARPTISFPALTINFSVNNTQQSIGGVTFYNPQTNSMTVLGDAGVDSDEFDRHVTVHEWGHFYEDEISRSESLGGPHTTGDILDMTIAFGEGWGNSLSGMVLSPDTVYKDASGPTNNLVNVIDPENNNTPGASLGWFSEDTTANILFDVFDAGGGEAFDNLSLGLGGIHDAMLGQRTTQALATIFSFVNTLQTNNPALQGDINGLLAVSGMVSPVADDFGSTETNNGGVPASVPPYTQAAINGGAVTFNFNVTSAADRNKLGANRYLRFTGNGNQVTVTSTSANDVDIFAFERGNNVANGANQTGNETMSFATTAGTEIVVRVRAFEVGNYSANITVTSP